MTNSTFIPVKIHGPIYTALNKYQYLLPSIATSAIGLVDFGYKGLGFSLFGAVDIIAKSYNIYNKPYLTSAVIGFGALNSFKSPYNIVGIVGAVIGGLFPTGIIHPHLDKAITPIMGAIYGSSFGPYGTSIGFSAGIIDEYLSYNNVTQAYLLTSVISNVAITNLISSTTKKLLEYAVLGSLIKTIDHYKIPEITTSIYLGISTYYPSNNSRTTREKSPVIELGNELYELYSKIIPEEQLEGFIENQAMALITGQVIATKMALINLKNLQEFVDNLKKLDQKTAGNEFFKKLLITPLYALGYSSASYATKHLNEYFMMNYRTIIRDQINDKYLDGEVALHLNKKRSTNIANLSKTFIPSKILLDKMISDINSIVETSILTDVSSNVVNALNAIGYLDTKNILYMLIHADLYNKETSRVTYYLIDETTKYMHNITLYSAKLDIKFNYIKSHPLETVINDANDFNKAGRNDLTEKLYKINGEKKAWDLVYDAWQNGKIWLDYFFNSIIVAPLVVFELLPGENAVESIYSIGNFNFLASWDSKNAKPIYDLRASIKRISELLIRMDEVKNPPMHLPNYDYKISDENAICLNKFKVGVKKESRLYIEDLCISGKNIAVTSVSGGGKSTFTNALGQIVHGDSWSEGSVTYLTKNGTKPYIAMTSQATYVTPEDALLELITFKKGFKASKQKDEVIKLLNEIKIDIVQGTQQSLISRLNVIDDWVNILSGGQKQKIDVIRLILNHKQADFLFLDEIFAGLDHDSIITIQNMFDKYFPNTMIMVIDHEAQSHNISGWYDDRLHFANNTAMLVGEFSQINEIDSPE